MGPSRTMCRGEVLLASYGGCYVANTACSCWPNFRNQVRYSTWRACRGSNGSRRCRVFGAANATAVTVSGFKVVSSGRAKDIHYANQGKKRRSDSKEGGFLLCSCVRVWVLWRLAGWLFSYSTALMPSEALAARNRVREALREVTL